MKKENFDSLIEDFNEKTSAQAPLKYEDRIDRLTLPIPKECKAKYNELQEISGKGFSKVLTEIIIQAINKAKI